LLSRKEALQDILRRAKGGKIRFSDHVVGRGESFYRNACRLGLEGIVSKRKDVPYRPGRGRDWLKVKCLQSQEFVIGGFTDPAGSRAGLGALLLGVHDDRGDLVYAGRVGTGFTERSLQDLRARLGRIEQESQPFSNAPAGAAARGVHWVKPKLVAEVAFTSWTRDGLLRHPSFQGLREDKPASSVTKERPVPVEAAGAGTGGEAAVAGIALTHPDRVLYPEQEITKRELAVYYEEIAEWILPHLRNRPLSVVRCPEGYRKECFYQRHIKEDVHESVRRLPLREKGSVRTYLAVDSLPGLISLVQMSVLELHTWGCRADLLERPDRLTFDLDPDPSVAWSRVIEAAQIVRRRLSDLGLACFVKTTGGKGLHVVVPLARKLGWEEVKDFSRAVAESIVREAPDRYTATMSKSKRKGRIFIDTLRNGWGATAVAAYSTRARPGAPVSTPLDWDELDPKLRSDQFTVRNLPQRLARLKKDPWENYEGARRAITAAMKKSLGIEQEK
ncbi:MAG: DNA ligase D, partial [Candidatus Binatia bacterium]